MLNLKKALVILLFILCFAWLYQAYFTIILPKQETIIYTNKEEKYTTKLLPAHNKNVNEINIKSEEKNVKGLTLAQLLIDNRFYDAMAYYLENTTEDNLKKIESYLGNLAKTNSVLALEYMHTFLDAVPESNVLKLIIDTYITQENFTKAIELIIQSKENYISQSEDIRLTLQLKEVAIKYIDNLMQLHEYATLIRFLEDMIAYDNNDSFYSYRLAKLYMMLDKVEEAGALLDTLQYDEVYAQNVKSMLNVIDKVEEEEYRYAIPLQKSGDHYTALVFLDGVDFKLMLDTGATYIFIDEDKASILSLMGEEIRLQTAGNDIMAKRANVMHLKVGNVEMSNVTVTLAPFKREGVDGLLGMNFFRQFTFFINQEESILYLNPKE